MALVGEGGRIDDGVGRGLDSGARQQTATTRMNIGSSSAAAVRRAKTSGLPRSLAAVVIAGLKKRSLRPEQGGRDRGSREGAGTPMRGPGASL